MFPVYIPRNGKPVGSVPKELVIMLFMVWLILFLYTVITKDGETDTERYRIKQQQEKIVVR